MDWRELRDVPPWDWPKDSAARLLDVLRDVQTTEDDLRLAAGLAGDFTVVNDELVEALLAIIESSDRSAELRSRSAISLGPALEHADVHGFDDPDDASISARTFQTTKETLHHLYDRADVPEVVRRAILEASVRAPEDWHRDAIRAAYAHGSEPWLVTVVFCMEYVGGFDAQILEALESPNPGVRYHAVKAAGAAQLHAAWPSVVELVTSALYRRTAMALRAPRRNTESPRRAAGRFTRPGRERPLRGPARGRLDIAEG